MRKDQGSVGVACLDRRLAAAPLPVYLQEVEIWTPKVKGTNESHPPAATQTAAGL